MTLSPTLFTLGTRLIKPFPLETNQTHIRIQCRVNSLLRLHVLNLSLQLLDSSTIVTKVLSLGLDKRDLFKLLHIEVVLIFSVTMLL